MKKKVLVLGAGRVGRTIALDLAERYQVTVGDISPEVIIGFLKDHKNITALALNINNRNELIFRSVVAKFDLVINALPGSVGFSALKKIIECGKNVVDISFAPEDPFTLKDLAEKNEVTAIVDCGIAPGLSNMIAGFHYATMRVESFCCYVGGLPNKKNPPFNYKAPFSPADVIEEYTRPARYVENGQIVTKPALSEVEGVAFNFLGDLNLEAFNTDGLRTLLQTLKIPNMWEKTMRYSGHAKQMEFLREAGFFEKTPKKIGHLSVSPLEMTTQVLFPQWQYALGEEDFTVMKIIINGKEKSKKVAYDYDVSDQYDQKTKTSSMARTTGFTCAAVARLLLEGKIKNTGLVTPEELGMDKVIFQSVIDYLRSKNISIEIDKF